MARKTTKKSGAMKSGVVDAPTSTQPVKIYKARGKYKIVDGTSQGMIEPSTPETRNEDEILNPIRRAKLLDLTRNLVRNSSLFNTVLGQLTTNVISTCGGKVVISTPNEEANKSLRKAFYNYTRNVDFYTGDTLNHLMKRVLREYVIGGDCVLIFDDGLVEDSGKVLLFESNQIVNVSPADVERNYGKGAWLSNGKVYSAHGRHIGTVVSKCQSQLLGDADPSKCYFLKKDPNGSPLDCYWYHFSSNWREGRGVSQAASAISTIHQLEDLVQSELMASRRNSQIFCWLTQTKDPQEQLPTPFGEVGYTDEDIASMTDDEIQQMAKQEAEAERIISFNKAKENSVVYEALPEGFNAQQLTMNHPNENVQTMVDWLANRCAASMGLSKVFATGNPQDSNWRSNQLFSWPAIRELQKDCEQVLDWCFTHYVKWAQKKGIIKAYIAEDFLDYVDWQWRSIDDFNEVTHQQAIEMKLRNMTSTLKEELGSDWKDKLEQYRLEIDYCKKNGLPHPAFAMISGGERHESFVGPQKDDGEVQPTQSTDEDEGKADEGTEPSEKK